MSISSNSQDRLVSGAVSADLGAARQKVATPTAWPDAGTYAVTQRVTLLCATRGAAIYYTVDGASPPPASARFDPYHLIVVEAVNDGDKGVKTGYTIRAFAQCDGMLDSDVATFTCTVDRRDKDIYVSQEVHPGIWMIRDYDDTKMYFIKGSRRALLIDAGLGSGDLKGYVEALAGGLPLDVVITHAHPDHIARMGQFQDDYTVYMHHADLPMVREFIQRLHYQIDISRITDIRAGFVFDLGDRKLCVYEAPGHTRGSIILLDAEAGYLFSSDAFGSNRPTIVDSLWMQNKGMARIDEYLSTLQVIRPQLRGKFKEMYTGHNDSAIYGETYLDNLQQAAQNLVDRGADVLTPSLRPTDVWQVVVGDRMSDPNWAAINVSRDTCLTAPPEQIATLSNLQLSAGALDSVFKPAGLNYTADVRRGISSVDITATATSSRYSGLQINGFAVKSGAAYSTALVVGENPFVIVVTAPDRISTCTYRLVVSRRPDGD